MQKIVFKDVANIKYSGELVEVCGQTVTVTNLKVEGGASDIIYGVTNLTQKNCFHIGETKVNLNNVVWYSIQEA